MNLSLTELISAAAVYKDVTLPGTTITVRVRRLSGGGRAAMMDVIRRWKDDPEAPQASADMQMVVLRHGLIDDGGHPLVVNDDDMALLKQLDLQAVDVLCKAILDISKVGQAAADEAEKNSASNQSDDSGSASPATSAAA